MLFLRLKKMISHLGMKSDLELAERLITKVGLALVPGSAFGNEGFMRLSFATSMENLEKAVERLQRACA